MLFSITDKFKYTTINILNVQAKIVNTGLHECEGRYKYNPVGIKEENKETFNIGFITLTK